MAYITKDFTKKIRTELKTAFPTIKFSVTLQHHSKLCVSIMESSTVDFSQDLKDEGLASSHRGVNHYHIEGNYKNEEILQKIVDICMADHWDKSDLMSDYHNCAYYFDLSIGKWDKPFVYTGEPIVEPTPEPEVEEVVEPVQVEEVEEPTVEVVEVETPTVEVEAPSTEVESSNEKVLKIESIYVVWSESNHIQDETYYTLRDYNRMAAIASSGLDYGYDKTKLEIKLKDEEDTITLRHDINERNPTLTHDLTTDGWAIVDLTRGIPSHTKDNVVKFPVQSEEKEVEIELMSASDARITTDMVNEGEKERKKELQEVAACIARESQGGNSSVTLIINIPEVVSTLKNKGYTCEINGGYEAQNQYAVSW